MPIDVTAARADTPATAHLIHLNNAGASLPPMPVLDATIDHLRLEAALGGYEAAEAAAAGLDHVYDAGGRLLGCHPSEIAFMPSATTAWWQAFLSIPFQPGDRILTARSEYGSGIYAMIRARQMGIDIEVVPDDASGQISLDALAEMLDERVRLVALTHVPTSGGLVNPAAEVGRLVRERSESLYLLDACQSAGQLPLDVNEIGCDFLSFTGRKFVRGPRGSGLLYVRESRLDELDLPPGIDGRAATWTGPFERVAEPGARRYETFEVSYAAKVGLGVALDYALDLGLDAIAERVGALADGLRRRLAAIPGVTVRDQGVQHCGIVTFTVEGLESAAVGAALRAEAVNVSIGTRTHAQLDLGHRNIDDIVRASVHYFNTDEELDRAADLVAVLA